VQNKDEGFWGEYKAKCKMEGCPGKMVFTHAKSAGLVVGGALPTDPGDPRFGRCPHCKRYSMVVTSIPEPPPLAGPRGFTKIPTK